MRYSCEGKTTIHTLSTFIRYQTKPNTSHNSDTDSCKLFLVNIRLSGMQLKCSCWYNVIKNINS